MLLLEESNSDKKIVLLFGCGNRDQNKRAKMGKVADNFSDKIYLTNDNQEMKIQQIRNDIKKGLKKLKQSKYPIDQKL